tara:strand:+ start:2660 stop:3451 length:792 start_codon:yes stop_codon:yes gene_type:complete
MNIIKIFLLSIIILIFYLYNKNIIEGIDILDNSLIPQSTITDMRGGTTSGDLMIPEDIISSINPKKIMIKINDSKLSFLTYVENNSLKNKRFIANIISPSLQGGVMNHITGDINGMCNNDNNYLPCTYDIGTIDNVEIETSVLPKLQDFFTDGTEILGIPNIRRAAPLQGVIGDEMRTGGFIPSKSYNKMYPITFSSFTDQYELSHTYTYKKDKNLNILNIINENDDNDYIQLEILDYLDGSGNPIKNNKERIKKYIYSQFLQ